MLILEGFRAVLYCFSQPAYHKSEAIENSIKSLAPDFLRACYNYLACYNPARNITEEILKNSDGKQRIEFEVDKAEYQLSQKSRFEIPYDEPFDASIFHPPFASASEEEAAASEVKKDNIAKPKPGMTVYNWLSGFSGKQNAIDSMMVLEGIAKMYNKVLKSVKDALAQLRQFGREGTDKYDKYVEELLFTKPEYCKAFFQYGDEFEAKVWGRLAARKEARGEVLLEFRGDLKKLYNEIHRLYPTIAGYESFLDGYNEVRDKEKAKKGQSRVNG